MKNLILALAILLLNSMSAQADISGPSFEVEHPIMVWTKPETGGNPELKPQPAKLVDLKTKAAFDGKYFKVVYHRSETPLPIDPSEIAAQAHTLARDALGPDAKDAEIEARAQNIAAHAEDLSMKAATSYDAFTRSRAYFRNVLSTPKPAGLGMSEADLSELDHNGIGGQTTIRLEMDIAFSDTVHFNKEVSLVNQALTVPPGEEFPEFGVQAWGRETWFFRSEKRNDPATNRALGKILKSQTMKFDIFKGLASQDLAGATSRSLNGTFAAEVLWQNLAVSFGLSQLVLPIVAGVFEMIPHHVLLESALIPEIAAHEYAHHALYRWFQLKSRSHIVEGFPNFFASKIAQLDVLGRNSPGISQGQAPRKINSKVLYSLPQESGDYAATSSFTFALLHDLEGALGDEGLSIILDAMTHLARDSALKKGPDATKLRQTDLQSAILSAIERRGPSPLAQAVRSKKIAAQRVFDQRGM